MPQVVHARLSFPDGSTFEDTASIGFTFQAATATPIAGADIVAYLSNLMNTPGGTSANALGKFISVAISRTADACPVEIFDVTAHLNGSPAGSPIFTGAITLPAASGVDALPSQLAVVCAYRAGYGVDIEKGVSETVPSTESAQDQGAPATHTGISKPRARDRGRFYLGPLNTSILESVTGTPPTNAGQVDTAAASDIEQDLLSLLIPNAGETGGAFGPVVWSRVGAIVKPIAYVAVDVALGVIRKRADTVIDRVLSWVPVA